MALPGWLTHPATVIEDQTPSWLRGQGDIAPNFALGGPGSPTSLISAVSANRWGQPFGSNANSMDIFAGGFSSNNRNARLIGRGIGSAYLGGTIMGAFGGGSEAATGNAAAPSSSGGAAGGSAGTAAGTSGTVSTLGTIKDVATVLSAVGALTNAYAAIKSSRKGEPAPPTIPGAVAMPTEITHVTQQNSIFEQLMRRGRASTILTSGGTLGA